MKIQYSQAQPPILLPFTEMTNDQAKTFFNWYISIIPERITILTQYVQSSPGFEHWINDLSPDSLNDLGKWFVLQIETRSRTEKEKQEIIARVPKLFKSIPIPDYDLTSFTFSLCFDVGVYISQVILKNIKDIHWKIQKERKSDFYYQHPVLIGVGKQVFNPTDLMITFAYGVARGAKGWQEFRDIYDLWIKILQDL